MTNPITRRALMAGPALALLASLGIANEAAAQQVTIRFPVEYNSDIAPGISNQEFIDVVHERSGGDIRIEFFPSGSLYRGLDLLQAVMRGDAEMTTLVSVFWSALSPQLSIFELPFAFPTHETFYAAADDAEFMAQAFAEIEERGATVIGVLVYDYLPIGNRVRPITEPADFRGLKMRALGRTNARTLELLGAEPVPINITEVGGALERGVIDGLNTPADAFISYGWETIVPYLTDSPHFFAFYPWAVNTRWWNGLSDEHRSIIQEAVDEVTLRHRERARAGAAEAMAQMHEAGVQIHTLSDQEIEQWMAAVSIQWTEAEEAFGAELVNQLRSFSRTD